MQVYINEHLISVAKDFIQYINSPRTVYGQGLRTLVGMVNDELQRGKLIPRR